MASQLFFCAWKDIFLSKWGGEGCLYKRKLGSLYDTFDILERGCEFDMRPFVWPTWVWGVDFPCCFLWYPLPIGRSVECAHDNYAFGSVSLLCRNRVGQHLVVYYLAVNCAPFQFILSFSPVYFLIFAVHCILPFIFSPFVFNLRREWCVRESDMNVDKHSLPKIGNDVCRKLTWKWTNTPCLVK